MEKFEKHIRDNREGFDSFEPSDGHMDRFLGKLTPARISLYQRIPYGIKVAAILILVAFSSILVYESAQRYYTSRQQPLEEILPGEYIDAKIYYSTLIEDKYSEIDRLSDADPERKEILLLELDEMDRLFRSIMKDLQTAPTDERVLSAMINHYQLKLEVMGQIIEQLEKVNRINSTYKSHEKTDV